MALNTALISQTPREFLGPGTIMDRHQTQAAPAGQQLSLREFLLVLDRYKVMIALIVGITTFAVLAQQLLTTPVYQSVAHVQVELIDAVGTNQADVNSKNAQRVANTVRLYRSRSVAEQVTKDLKLTRNKKFIEESGRLDLEGREGRQTATNTLLNMVEISAEDGSDLMTITVSSRFPKLAAYLANQYPESARIVRNARSDERRGELVRSLIRERKERGIQLMDATQAVAQFRAANRMLVGAGGPEDLAQLNRIAGEAASASAMRAGSAAQSAGVSRAARYGSTAAASSPALDQLERRRAELVTEQSRLATVYGPNHTDMKRVSAELATISGAIASERQAAQATAAAVANAEAARMAELARSEAARDDARARTLAGIAGTLENRAYRNTANTVELERLVQDAELADQAYDAIAARIEQVRAQMQLEGVSSTVVSPAIADFDPVAPAPVKMTFLAFLGSAILSLLVAFARELIDDRLRTAAQIQRHFALPTFGMLPIVEEGLSADPEESPVIQRPQSLFAEVARSTLAEVRALAGDTTGQVVLLTSPLPGDGKSTVALTLAAAGSALGLRVAVLDLDLRQPGFLQRVQQGLPTPDIVEIVTGKADLNDLVRTPVASNLLLENVSGTTRMTERMPIVVVSANEPLAEPAAVLSSRRILDLVAHLRANFDLVIVNAPATLAVRDARAMCGYADHTLMVARWGKTTINQMTASLELLSTNIAGVVYDQVDYPEHARRRYGDSVQYYVQSSSYYKGAIPRRRTLASRLRWPLGRKRTYAHG